jgi:hypothetical protein
MSINMLSRMIARTVQMPPYLSTVRKQIDALLHYRQQQERSRRGISCHGLSISGASMRPNQ